MPAIISNGRAVRIARQGSCPVTQKMASKSRLRRGIARFLGDERGNVYFLVAAATLPMVGMVGSGIDIGRAYMADLRLQQACDAGVLAGRRAMAGGTYSVANKSEATKMFNINFDTGTYGSTNIVFNTAQDGASEVDGTASAKLPTTLMKMFGHNEFDLAVTCTAKLEVSNVDVMLVLDVTGSMNSTNAGDTMTRLQALKLATKNFFDTMTAAQIGDGRMRFGVVPYGRLVNIGSVLNSANSSWLDDEVELPSREPVLKDTWGTGTKVPGTPVNGPYSYSPFVDDTTVSGKNATTCPQTVRADTAHTSTNSATDFEHPVQYEADGDMLRTYTRTQNFKFTNYQHVWRVVGSTSRCWRQKRDVTYTRTTAVTRLDPLIKVFDKYRYTGRTFNVAAAKSGGSVTYNVGDNGGNVTASWNGCIIERKTMPFAANATAPAEAYDMNIDLVPTSDADTKWKLLMGDLAFPRSSTAPEETTTDRSSFGANGCVSPSTKLTTMTAADKSTFNAYIDGLQTINGTYHSVGMIWGARLISPTGIFASENATAPNGRPIQRHLIFMTDGNTDPDTTHMGLQSHEPSTGRLGWTTEADGIARIDNRFLQICSSLKTKNVTIWTVDFDLAATPTMVTCASGSDKAFISANSTQLNQQFQAIARQISKLRISQ
jgi:Flp pilus assembly protein TadG